MEWVLFLLTTKIDSALLVTISRRDSLSLYVRISFEILDEITKYLHKSGCSIRNSRRLLKQHKERNRDLHIMFIDVEKKYNKICWRFYRYAWSLKVYLFHSLVWTWMRIVGGNLKHFPIKMWLYQGSIFSLFLFFWWWMNYKDIFKRKYHNMFICRWHIIVWWAIH